MSGMHGTQEIQKTQLNATALDACIFSSTHRTLHQKNGSKQTKLRLICFRLQLIDQRQLLDHLVLLLCLLTTMRLHLTRDENTHLGKERKIGTQLLEETPDPLHSVIHV